MVLLDGLGEELVLHRQVALDFALIDLLRRGTSCDSLRCQADTGLLLLLAPIIIGSGGRLR